MAGGEANAARVGSHLPALAGAGGAPEWRPQYTRDALLLAVLHGPECRECARFAERLRAAEPEFRQWDGRLLVSHGEAATAAVAGAPPLVLVADRFGQVYHVAGAGSRHGFPEPRELEEWLRFIAMQCPE